MRVAEVKQRIKLYVTPGLLRAWADGMEEEWPKLLAGDSTVWYDFIVDERVDISLCFDQDRMGEECQKKEKRV